jgi:hypothetical protein
VESNMKASDIPSPGPGKVVDKPKDPHHTVSTENDSNGKRKTVESNMKASDIPSPGPGKVVDKPEGPRHAIATENAASTIVLTNIGATPTGKKDLSQNTNGSSSKKLSQASSNDDTNMSIRSPNLLCSSTPEKTQASQGTQMSSPSLTQPQTQA